MNLSYALAAFLLRRRRLLDQVSTTTSPATPARIFAGTFFWSRRKALYAAIPTYPGMPEAVEALLQAMVPSSLNWAGRGLAPPEVTLPYAAVGKFAELPIYEEDGTASPPYDDDGSFPLSVFAPSSEACDALAGSLTRALKDYKPRLLDGDVLFCRRTNRVRPELDPDPMPDGSDCWISHLEFTTIIARNA